MRILKLLAAVSLASAAFISWGALTLANDAGALPTPVTLYVNSTSSTGASDCALQTNTDCGLDDAISAFDAITTSDVAVTIEFASGNLTFATSSPVIVNSTTGISLDFAGAGVNETTIDGDGAGWAMFVRGPLTMTIDGVTITNGTSPGGGGILNEIATLTLSDSAITNIDVPDSLGGAIDEDGGSLTLTNDTFNNDHTVQGGGPPDALGGALLLDAATSTITDSTFSNDETLGGPGGAIYVANTGTTTLDDDTFTNNQATTGGALYLDGGTTTMTNDTFFDNASSDNDSSTIYQESGSSSLNDVTVDNSATPGEGAIDNVAGSLSVANSILDDAACYSLSSAITDGGFNVESDDSCAFGVNDVVNSSTIDLTGSLSANGSTGPDTLAIDADSSAYQEVPSVSCTTLTDERGDSRPGGPASACDAGAYELQYSAPAPSALTQVIDFSSLAAASVGSSVNLVASATSGFAVSFASSTPAICTVSGDVLSVLAAGTCTVVASQSGGGAFRPASDVTQSFIANDVTAPPAPTTPGAPGIRRTATSGSSLTLYVRAPADGGSPITGYQYSLNAGRWTDVARAANGLVRVRGLRPGSDAVRVRARNNIGPGPSSKLLRLNLP